MMFRRTVPLSCLGAGAAALALVLAVSSAVAQPPKADVTSRPAKKLDGGPLPPDGSDSLDKAYREIRTAVRDLEDGKVEAAKEHEPAIDTLAKWYTYRLTWDTIQNEPRKIDLLMTDLDREFTTAGKAPNTQAFRQLFARALAKNARDVLNNRTPIARVNAARVLWRVASTGEPDVAVALVEVLETPEHDPGTRYWACKGLQEFLAPDGRMPPTLPKDPALLARITRTLLNLIDQKLPVTPATPQDRLDGWRVYRREAIHALALTQNPAVVEQNKLAGRTAQVLLRVIRKDGFVPEPRWDEVVEAAIGIGWLQGKLYPAYQPDYAVWNAAFAVSEFAQKYADEKDTERGWKYYSARLGEAFDNLRADVAKNHAKDKELVTYVNDVLSHTAAVLRLIETKGALNPGDLAQWLQEHPPKTETVYKGVEDSKVKPAEPTEK
jgi:hypothetical protein